MKWAGEVHLCYLLLTGKGDQCNRLGIYFLLCDTNHLIEAVAHDFDLLLAFPREMKYISKCVGKILNTHSQILNPWSQILAGSGIHFKIY